MIGVKKKKNTKLVKTWLNMSALFSLHCVTEFAS